MRDILKIETERLILRPIALSDAKRVSMFIGDEGIARMTARIPHPYPAIGAEGWLLIMAARNPRENDFVFAVDIPGEGLIGVLGAHGIPNGEIEIGYWFGRPYWGAGYASEAVSAFVVEAAKIAQPVAGHFVDNPASGRVLERAGFVYTGETEEMFSLGRKQRVTSRRMRYEALDRRARNGAAVEACA